MVNADASVSLTRIMAFDPCSSSVANFDAVVCGELE
jgi:hypothetical protein